MPGNEVADKVHNFFEQDNLSQGQDQSQVANGNWQRLNNSLWVGNQRQVGTQLSSNPKSYNVQPSGPERGDGRQSPQMPLDTNLSQPTSRAEFAKSQSRNQQLNSNGFMHEQQGFQTRQNHAEFDFLGEDTVSNRHNLISGGVPILESQEGNAIENRSVLTRNSGRPEPVEAPTNLEFLSGQPQFMRGQQLDMPQPRPRQQSGFNNMPQWQQNLMLKHLQELESQRFYQQYQEAKQRNQMNQLSASARQAASEQLPPLVNGMPIHDGSNYFWQSEHMGGDKVPSTSQMFMTANMNWAQRGGSPAGQGSANGLMISEEQSHAFRSMGLVPQQFEQSLYGAPIASTRGVSNQYPHIQGISHDSADSLNKTGGNQVEKPIMQSSAFNNSFHGNQGAVFQDQVSMQDELMVSKQVIQGKKVFGHVPIQSVNTGLLLGNSHQVNSVIHDAPMQEFHGRQEQSVWSGNLPEKAVTQVGPSQGSVSLDPTEKKILFNTDENLWDASLGRSLMGAGGFGNSSDTDYPGAFPSLQSGSWSALMQSAVAEASSSDTGLQDEWSGLSYQKTEPLCGNQPATFSDGGKQQMNWADNNLQSASSLTSRPFPLFNSANMSPSSCNVQGVQQSGIQSPYQQSEGVQTEVSQESVQRSPKDASQWLDQRIQRNPLAEGIHQIHLSNIEQSENSTHSADTELNTQKMRGSWVHQRSMPSYNTGSATSNKQNGWNINDSLSQSGDVVPKIRENVNNVQLSQRNDQKRRMHEERLHDIGMWKVDNRIPNSSSNSTGVSEQVKFSSGNLSANREDSRMSKFHAGLNPSNAGITQEIKQQIPNNHFSYGQHAVDSLKNYIGDENVGNIHRGHQILESSMNNSDHVSGENCDQKEMSNESHKSNQSHHTVTGRVSRQNLWSNASDSHALSSANQQSEGPVGQRVSGSRNFYHHPMGNLEVKVNTTDTTKHVIHSEVLPEQVAGGSKSHDQGYFGQSKFVGDVRDNTRDMGKGHLPDFQGYTKRTTEKPSRGVLADRESTRSGSNDGSTGFLPPNQKAVRASQNMLELLHKVDQSREQSTVNNFGSSDINHLPEVPESEASDASVANLQRNQFASSQGFGLRLGPPSQRLPVSNHAFSPQNSPQIVNDLKAKHQDSDVREKSQTWSASTSSVQSSHHSHGMSQGGHWDNKPIMLEKASGSFTSGQPNQRNDLLHQRIPSSSGQVMTNHSFDRLASRFRTTQDSNNGALTDQSAHGSLPGAASRIPRSHDSPTDASQPVKTNLFNSRDSGQDHTVLEAAPASQPMQGTSQPGAFSGLHNVWTNVSARQYSVSGLPQKVPSNLFQSTNLLNNNLEATTRATQNSEGQDIKKGGNFPSEYGTCSVNSQRSAFGEERIEKGSSWRQIPSQKVDPTPQTAAASLEQESVAKHLPHANSVPGLLAAHAHQQEVDKRRYGKDPSLMSQTDQVSLQSPACNRDIEAFGRSLKPTHGLHQSYSLLHQVQAMKDVETDPNNNAAKRFKGADCGLDAQQVADKAGHQSFYGYNTMNRNAANELHAGGRPTSFTSGESNMRRFSSELKEQNKIASSQLGLGIVPAQDMVTLGGASSQIHSSHSGSSSVGFDHSKVSPNMAASLFEQYGTIKNGQMAMMYDARRIVQLQTASQQFISGKTSESPHGHSSAEQMHADDDNQVGRLSTTTSVASELLSHSLPPEYTDQNLAVVEPKKRKSTSEFLPWHKKIALGSLRLQNISMAEHDWAHAANRLIEKVEDEAEMIEDGQPLLRSRRRLILTTQLIQQLFRPAPPTILSADATSNYESVTYTVAKLALGDACSLISNSENDSHVPPEKENKTSARSTTSKRVSNRYFSEVAESFIDRARKLETDLLRLDKRASILDIRVECQDIERFSVINRFAKFHGRGQGDASVAPQRTYPQRYVTALSMPRNVPEGVQCLSL